MLIQALSSINKKIKKIKKSRNPQTVIFIKMCGLYEEWSKNFVAQPIKGTWFKFSCCTLQGCHTSEFTWIHGAKPHKCRKMTGNLLTAFLISWDTLGLKDCELLRWRLLFAVCVITTDYTYHKRWITGSRPEVCMQRQPWRGWWMNLIYIFSSSTFWFIVYRVPKLFIFTS